MTAKIQNEEERIGQGEEFVIEKKAETKPIIIILSSKIYEEKNAANESIQTLSEEYIALDKKPSSPFAMKNYGEYSFINAAFQCLCSIPEVNEYFYEQHFSKIQYTTCKKSKDVCKDIAAIYKEIFFNKAQEIAVDALIKLSPYGQTDPYEYLLKSLFPAVSEETHPIVNAKKEEGWNSQQVWKWFKTYHLSVFDVLFSGQYETRIECKACHKDTITFDHFQSLSIPAFASSLASCLNMEFESQIATNIDYNCPYCKLKTSAKKIKIIDRHPKFLLIHFQRMMNETKKISKFIEYPLELDLNKYAKLHHTFNRFCVLRKDEIRYSLEAVCVHHGGPTDGHYYAVCKRDASVCISDLITKIVVHF